MTTEKPTLLEIYSVLTDAPAMLRALRAMKSDLDAARQQLEEAKAERDAANEKLTATYCSYCGHREERDDELGSRITQHIRECPKHPMREVEKECLRYDSEATRARNILTAAGVPDRKPDGTGCVSMPDRVAMLAAGLTESIHQTDAAVQQVSRLTEALRGIYETKVTRPGGSFGFNIRFNGIYSRELSDLVCLAPAARQGEKEKA